MIELLIVAILSLKTLGVIDSLATEDSNNKSDAFYNRLAG